MPNNKTTIEVRDTSTTKSQAQINDLLNNNNITVDNYKYIDYQIKPIVLKNTIYDLNSQWNEKSKLREEFEIDSENKIISIPNFFVKIDGKLTNDKKQKELIKTLTKNATVFYDFNVQENYYQKLASSAASTVENIVKNKKMTSDAIDKILEVSNIYISNADDITSSLNSNIQKMLIKKLDEFIGTYLKSSTCKVDIQALTNFVLNIIYLNPKIVLQLNSWDFSAEVPKIVIFDESNQKTETQSDYLLTDFFNFLGMDIAIVTPSAKPCINSFEFELNTGLLSTITLDKIIKPIESTRKDILNKSQKKKKIIMGAAAAGILVPLSVFVGVNSYSNFKVEQAEYAAVVSEQIDEIGNVTLSDETIIKDSDYVYSNLSSYAKKLVTNYQVLIDAKSELTKLQEKQESIENVNDVISKISQINLSEVITTEDTTIISEATLLYDELSDAEKKLVTNYSVLEQAQSIMNNSSIINNLITADDVILSIDSIGTVTLDSEDIISSTLIKYNSLSENEKNKVSNYDTLVAANEKYKTLAAEALKNQAVKDVIAKIDTLKDARIDQYSYDAIVDAYYAYSDLSEEDKSKVTNYEILEQAEKAYDDAVTPKSFFESIYDAMGTNIIFVPLLFLFGIVTIFFEHFDKLD